MEFPDWRHWAVHDKQVVRQTAEKYGSAFVKAIGFAYSLSDVHEGRRLMNAFGLEFSALYKKLLDDQVRAKQPPVLQAKASDEVTTEETTEETKEDGKEKRGHVPFLDESPQEM